MDDNEEKREVLIDEEVTQNFCRHTVKCKKGLSRVEPSNQIFITGRYKRFQRHIETFEVNEDDVWVATYISSGTTWMTELVWCLLNKLDFEKAKSVPLNARAPFFDFTLVDDEDVIDENNLSFHKPNHVNRPRTIKTHLNYDLLPKQVHKKKAKIITVIRNPRDVCISLLNHLRIWNKYTGDLQTLVDMTLKDAGPYYGPYFPNVLGYWKHRNDPNVLVVFFEEMKKDFRGVTNKVAEFLGVKLTENDIEKLCEHCSLESMKANPMVNDTKQLEEIKKRHQNTYEGQFVNKGKSGGWKDNFDDGTIKRFEEWEAKWLKDTGLNFIYEA